MLYILTLYNGLVAGIIFYFKIYFLIGAYFTTLSKLKYLKPQFSLLFQLHIPLISLHFFFPLTRTRPPSPSPPLHVSPTPPLCKSRVVTRSPPRAIGLTPPATAYVSHRWSCRPPQSLLNFLCPASSQPRLLTCYCPYSECHRPTTYFTTVVLSSQASLMVIAHCHRCLRHSYVSLSLSSTRE